MISVSHPEASEKNAVAELIFHCFPEDSTAFLSAVMDNVFRPEESLVARAGEDIAAAVLLPRFRLSDGRDFGYVYCLCTSPEFRGMGLMRTLLARAEAFCFSRGDCFVALVPANEKLAQTYSKMGYLPLSHTVSSGAPSDRISGRPADENDIDLLSGLYEAEFASVPHVKRSRGLWKTLMTLYSADGGGVFLTHGGYVFAESDEKGLRIRETASAEVPEGMAALLPAQKGSPRVYAKGYAGQAPLLNLLFD